MARTIIRVANPSLSDNQQTFLTQDVAVGWTTLTVSSTIGFWAISWASDYYYLVIWRYWEDTTEIVLASAKTDSTFTVWALKYSHSSSDPITYIPYNQVKVYWRLTSWGANNLLATIDIDCTNQVTRYDYTSTTYYYFVTSYYRSATTAEESDFSDETTSATFTVYSAKKIIEAGVKKAMTRVDENPDASLSWNACIDLLNEWLLEIITRKKKWQCLHKISAPTTTTANVAYIDKPTDMSILEFITVNGNKIQYISKMRYNQLTISTTQSPGVPAWYTIKNDKIYFYPTPSDAHNVVFEYYAMPTFIDSLTTEVKKEFATILIYFIWAQAAYIRNNEKRWDKLELKFQQTLSLQIEDVTWYEQIWDAEETERTSIYWMEEFEDTLV